MSTHPGGAPDGGHDLEADPQGREPVVAGDGRLATIAHALDEMPQLVHERLAVLGQVRDLDQAALPVAHAAVGQELRMLDAVHLDLLAGAACWSAGRSVPRGAAVQDRSRPKLQVLELGADDRRDGVSLANALRSRE